MTLTQITEKGIKDGEILNADINASAAIAKSKLETFVNNNADNRVITGSGTANTLNGESDVIIDSSGRVQIGGVTGPNNAKLFVAGTNSTNYMTFRNTSAGDGSGARWNNIRFQGTQSGGEVSDLVHLQANHDGTGDDEKGSFQILVNDGNDGDSLQERMRITSGGNVGIGTTSPNNMLHLSGTDPIIQFTDTAGGDSFGLFASHTNYLGFYNFTDSRVDMVIDGSGNVGIGTTTPTSPDGSNADNSNNGKVFTIYGDSPAINLIHNTAGGASAGSTDYAAINFGRNGSSSNPYRAVIGYKQSDDILRISANNHIAFDTGGDINANERMRIDSGGQVLIGLLASAANSSIDDLQVGNPNSNTQSGITIGSNDEAAIAFANNGDARAGSITYNMGSDAFIFKTNGQNERMRIDSSGNVGIGTSSPAKLLDVKSESNNTESVYVLRNQTVNLQAKVITTSEAQFGTETSHPFAFLTSNVEKMRIDTSGNIMFGTTSSTIYDDSSGSGVVIRGATGAVDIMRDNDVCLFLNRNTGDGQMIRMARAGTSKADISIRSSSLCFDVGNNSEKMRILSDGHVCIQRTDSTIDSSNFGTAIGGAGIYVSRNVTGASHSFGAFGNQGSALIMGDGDLLNTNNSYGQLSDETLKQDIVDAASQWNDIKNIRVRKFRFKDNPTGVLQIGVVAQEVEKISAGLVSEIYKDGKANSGDKVKSVKYSVLHMKAIKALQEAMTKIEILETKVAALEAK